MRRIVTINLQIKVHAVISVLALLRRRATSDIWFFGFFFFIFFLLPGKSKSLLLVMQC